MPYKSLNGLGYSLISPASHHRRMIRSPLAETLRQTVVIGKSKNEPAWQVAPQSGEKKQRSLSLTRLQLRLLGNPHPWLGEKAKQREKKGSALQL